MKFETKAIRNQSQRTHNREHSVPMYLSSSFVFPSAEVMRDTFAGEQEGIIYSRYLLLLITSSCVTMKKSALKLAITQCFFAMRLIKIAYFLALNHSHISMQVFPAFTSQMFNFWFCKRLRMNVPLDG